MNAQLKKVVGKKKILTIVHLCKYCGAEVRTETLKHCATQGKNIVKDAVCLTCSSM